MDLYAENILDHYKHPRNAELLPHPDVSHREENASCGDDLNLTLTLKNGVIAEIGWSGQGCAISQAAMSLLSEELTGKSLDEAGAMKKVSILALLGVPVGPRRLKCALLCLHTLKNTVRKVKGQEPESWLRNVEIDN